jgi:hypothetical protein
MMKKIPIIDIVSLLIIFAIGLDLYRMHDRLRRLELVAGGSGDALDSASLLPMSVATSDGRQVTIGRGQPRLIFYMSTHCGVCAHNMPGWSAVANQLGHDRVLFVIGNPAEAPQMPAYLAKYGLSGFSAVTADSEVVGRYYITTVPKTVLVQADGKVAKVWRGVVTAGAVLEGWNSIVKR